MKPVPETVYTPESPFRNPLRLLKQIFSENWARRELCTRLFWRNIRSQYRQTFFGFLWIFLPAIVTAAVWILLYSMRIVQFENDFTRNQYIAYVLTGMILWQCFVEAYTAPIRSYEQNRNMMSKINFPREVVIMVAFGEVLFNALIRCAVLLVVLLMMNTGVVWTVSTLLFPVAFFGLVLIGITIGLLLVPLGALYLDIGRVLTIITPVWMILTPVIYPTPTEFPANVMVYCNLASPVLVTARDYLLGAVPEYQFLCWIQLIGVVPVFLFSILFYRVSIPILLERSGN